jgi:nucleoside-diphosphate-sugar epimerase
MVDIVAKISNKQIMRKHKMDAPTGVRGRNSDNSLIRSKLGWDYSLSLEDGLTKTYKWISEQIYSLSTSSKN